MLLKVTVLDYSLCLFSGEPLLVSLVKALEVVQTDPLFLQHTQHRQGVSECV